MDQETQWKEISSALDRKVRSMWMTEFLVQVDMTRCHGLSTGMNVAIDRKWTGEDFDPNPKF